MCISAIEIKNVKGIDHKQFTLELMPNKPNLLVAANGFGKSSIATAFASMNSRRMTLADNDHHKEDSKSFEKAINWLQYIAEKKYYQDLIQSFCSSNWQWAKLSEDKKKKTLCVVFPQAHQLSNGQRDVLTLVVQMHKALYEGSKKPLVLVIDEVFDYLDDANLVDFQYYVTSLFQESQSNEGIIIN